MNRRDFLRRSTVLTGLSVTGVMTRPTRAQSRSLANSRITVAVTGVRGRGNALLTSFASQPDVDVKYVCDLDNNVLARRTDEVNSLTGRKSQAITDFRVALDDTKVDALVLGTPDHWHAIPTIMACQAEKDVYVEKPDGHNTLEGRTMVAAARKHGRIVQLGTQARSSPYMLEAIDYIR